MSARYFALPPRRDELLELPLRLFRLRLRLFFRLWLRLFRLRLRLRLLFFLRDDFREDDDEEEELERLFRE